jgi:thioredoxin reductase (NADPH)
MAEEKNKYSLIIIGAGPAGLTASIYASRYKVDNLIIGEALGGLAFEAHKICNFPTEEEISGLELVTKIQKHTQSLGANLLTDRVVRINKEGNEFKVTTQGGKEFLGSALLLAVGTERRRMNLPDEEKFIGKGVSYCATCDAMFYRDKVVAVVGGSDSANTASLYLAEVAKKVYQIYRRDKLRGEMMWVHQIENNSKIEVIYNTEVAGLVGKEKLEKIILNKHYQGKNELAVDGLFVEIGTVPQKVLVEELSLAVDNKGYIKVDPDQQTSQSGVWAAGDITTNSNYFHQIITACAEGAVAAESIFKFLQEKK